MQCCCCLGLQLNPSEEKEEVQDTLQTFLSCSEAHIFCPECLKTWIQVCTEKKSPVYQQNETFFLTCPMMEKRQDTDTDTEKKRCGVRVNLLADALQDPSSKELLKRFVQDLVSLQREEEEEEEPDEKLIHQILEIANVHCPGCDQVVDLVLDGCCATIHESCKTRFCWICLEWGFISSEDAHQHVRIIHGGDVFLEKAKIEAAIKQRQLREAQKWALRLSSSRLLQKIAFDSRIQQTLTQEAIAILQGKERFKAEALPFAFIQQPVANPPLVLLNQIPEDHNNHDNDDNDGVGQYNRILLPVVMRYLTGQAIDWEHSGTALINLWKRRRTFRWMTGVFTALLSLLLRYRMTIFPVVAFFDVFVYWWLYQLFLGGLWTVYTALLLYSFVNSIIGATLHLFHLFNWTHLMHIFRNNLYQASKRVINWCCMTSNIIMLIWFSAYLKTALAYGIESLVGKES